MFRHLIYAVAFTTATTMALAQSVPSSDTQIRLSFAPVVKLTTPAVVNIFAKQIVATQENPFANDPFFSDFFGGFGGFGKQTERVQNSLGSGVVLSKNGLVVSNFHVVGEATEIRVVLNDRREFDADILLADKTSDLAVLKLRGVSDLPALELRDSDAVEVGDLVLAIGNPFGVGQTVSSGIISGLARSGGAVGNARGYFLQTDAAINPGNSGGALVDMAGRLVGINTSILTRSGGSNGIGFAIPSNLVAGFLAQAKAGQTSFQRPWAGIVGQVVDSDLAEGFDLERPEGMVVVDMHPASPFAQAGLSVDDVIVSIDGKLVNGPSEMLFHMTVLGIGNSGRVEYFSGGKLKSTTLKMIEAPDEPDRNVTEVLFQSPLQGLTVSHINPAVIAELGLPLDSSGILVMEAELFAKRVGLKAGDILLSINGSKTKKVRDVMNAAAENTRRWNIELRRGGRKLSMRFQI